MKVKDIPKFENLKIGLRINVFELNGKTLTPIHINENELQPQFDLMLYKNHDCLITTLHCLTNKNLHMKHVCRRCLTVFSLQPVLLDHMERRINQQPTIITFSWKDHLKFENHYMKIPLPFRVFADFECIIQPQNTPEVLFKQIPIAVGLYLFSALGNYYYSYFGFDCVTWFVNKMLTSAKIASNYFKTNLDIEFLNKKKHFNLQKRVGFANNLLRKVK